MPKRKKRNSIFKMAAGLAAASYMSCVGLALDETKILSPDGNVQFKVLLHEARLEYAVTFRNRPVVETSPMVIVVDGVNLTEGVEVGKVDSYQLNETYPWRGVHSQAVNHCNGAEISITHKESKMSYTVGVRAYNDGIAFRFVVPGEGDRIVSSEATTFTIPDGSTVWYHDLATMHYEGVHEKKSISEAAAGEWAAPPLTVKLPSNLGYASITEAALMNYSGMGLQADGNRGFILRLGHEHPASYPYVLRYGEENAERLRAPAVINGTIKTPWRVVMIGADLNTLVNCDIIHNVSPPPDKELFPDGFDAEWLKPGRAVWGYLTSVPRTLEGMKEFSRLAGEMGFEYHVVEGHWARWPVAQQKELVDYSREQGIRVLFWRHSRSIQDPAARREFFQHCHDIGVAGMKLDFFDHEAKETIDLYQACLKEAAELGLIIDFHGANKPAGESRTWPNEMTREGIRGYEWRGPWAEHNTTLPFTRMLAGHADYTPMHFGDRRCETSEAHQIASAMVFSAPLLIYAENPANMLKHPAVEVIKQIPSVWDETIALPACEIGEVAAFAKRSGEKWFISVMNGPTARHIQIDLTFLDDGDYKATFVRDEKGDATMVSQVRSRQTFGPKPGVIIDNSTVRNNDSLYIELVAGGGFVALFSK